MKQFRLILILWLCMAMNAKANETTANLLQQGDSCLSRYDVFHATQYYQNYLEANPSHLGARRKLASCYRKVGNYTACISCLDKIPSDSINHEDMRMFYYAYLNQSNNDKVSLWGERIAFLFPYDSEIIASLAVHYNGVNKPDRAEKWRRITFLNVIPRTYMSTRNMPIPYSCNSNTMRLYPCMRN